MKKSKFPNDRDILSTDDVLEIKKELKNYIRGMNKTLAKKYGVHPVTISDIKTKKRWKHINI